MNEVFAEDGIHLNKAGCRRLEDDIIAGVRSVFKDIKPKTRKTTQTPHHHDKRNTDHDSRGDYGGRYVAQRQTVQWTVQT